MCEQGVIIIEHSENQSLILLLWSYVFYIIIDSILHLFVTCFLFTHNPSLLFLCLHYNELLNYIAKLNNLFTSK